MDEAKLIERLRAIEALFAGATTPGERTAADRARERILERLRGTRRVEQPVEYKLALPDVWSRRLMLALLRRYGLRPYRYRGQRRTTVMVMAPASFVDGTLWLWPEYQQLNTILIEYLAEVTERVVASVVHEDVSDAPEVSEPARLPPGGDGAR
jgi:hypothetical protein